MDAGAAFPGPDPAEVRRFAALWGIGVSARLVRSFAARSGGAWSHDPMAVDAIAKRVEQIGELSKRLSPDDVVAGVRGSAAMRDVLAHNYRRLDKNILASVVENDVPILASRPFRVPEDLLQSLRQSTRIVLISGIPGSGKTDLLQSLPLDTFAPQVGDEADDWAPELHEAWDQAIAGDDAPLLLETASMGRVLVIEWGFPARHLDVIESMLARGYDAHFLDGDDASAIEAWQARNANRDPGPAVKQLAELRAIETDLGKVFAGRRVQTVTTGPSFMDRTQLRTALGLQT